MNKWFLGITPIIVIIILIVALKIFKFKEEYFISKGKAQHLKYVKKLFVISTICVSFLSVADWLYISKCNQVAQHASYIIKTHMTGYKLLSENEYVKTDAWTGYLSDDEYLIASTGDSPNMQLGNIYLGFTEVYGNIYIKGSTDYDSLQEETDSEDYNDTSNYFLNNKQVIQNEIEQNQDKITNTNSFARGLSFYANIYYRALISYNNKIIAFDILNVE